MIPNSVILNDMVQLESLSSSRQGEMSNQGERTGRLDKPDLRRYSRRDKAEEAIMQSTQSQESSPGELIMNLLLMSYPQPFLLVSYPQLLNVSMT